LLVRRLFALYGDQPTPARSKDPQGLYANFSFRDILSKPTGVHGGFS